MVTVFIHLFPLHFAAVLLFIEIFSSFRSDTLFCCSLYSVVLFVLHLSFDFVNIIADVGYILPCIFEIVNTFFDVFLKNFLLTVFVFLLIIEENNIKKEVKNMENTELARLWRHFLIDIGKSETQVAKDCGKAQQNLNRSINNGSIKFVDICNIVEKYGYEFKLIKK